MNIAFVHEFPSSMASMAIYDQKSPPCFIGLTLRNKDLFEPLDCGIVTFPAGFTCGKVPIIQKFMIIRIFRKLLLLQKLIFEDYQWS